jgi:hypothetical protein
MYWSPGAPWSTAARGTRTAAAPPARRLESPPRRLEGPASRHCSRTSGTSAFTAVVVFPPRSVNRSMLRPKLDLTGCPTRVADFATTWAKLHSDRGLSCAGTRWFAPRTWASSRPLVPESQARSGRAVLESGYVAAGRTNSMPKTRGHARVRMPRHAGPATAAC